MRRSGDPSTGNQVPGEKQAMQPVTPVLGQTLCAAHDLNFAAVFAQQFHLSKSTDTLPGFRKIELGDWQMQVGPDLPVAYLSFADGAGHLALLGVAVDAEGDVLTSELLSLKAAPWYGPDELIAWLNACAGRFAFVILKGNIQRLYLDPIGSLGAVYEARTQIVGSTLNLVLARDVEENTDYPLTQQAVLETGRFGFGHTPDKWAKRLLPNHFLDLNGFAQRRFWPLPGDIYEPDEAQQDALLDTIVGRLRQVISSLSHHDPNTYLPLSGGLDSRLLLACAKQDLDRIKLFSHAENQMSRKDTRIAGRLAQFVKRPMQVIDPIRDPAYAIEDEAVLMRFSKAHQIATGIGRIGDEIPRIRHEVLMARPPGGLILRGNGSDFLKAVLWRRGVREYTRNTRHSIKNGIRMMMLSDKTIVTNADIQQAYEEWYGAFSGVAAQRAYDFMFSEQFLSHGLGNLMYGMTNNFYICPFNDRRMLAAATCLPPDRRARLEYNLTILDKHAPELHGVHYARNAVNLHLKALRDEAAGQPEQVT